MKKYVAFGELMLRLSAPVTEVTLQSPVFNATFGGSEANFSIALANYKEDVKYITVLPENAIAEAAIKELRGFNVDVSDIKRSGNRIGIYYTETGASMRPSKVIYDRAHSSISEVSTGIFDWDKILTGAHWFHTTGITPAISEGAADVTLEAMKVAKANGIKVSFDLNYREKLWKWGKSPIEVMPEMLKYVDVLIANEEDCQKCLGVELDVDVASGKLDPQKYTKLASKIINVFPNITHIAVSLRESISADWNNWSVVMATSNNFFVSKQYEIRDIVDRVGGGDSFASGLVWGLNNLSECQSTVEFAAAASALKHTIRGDYNRITIEDVLTLSNGDASGRIQR
ncbi:MAG: sugar kinase [Acidaminococcaceae bacterium]|nr:sugar kinase [Acidaminococcaceae bacterium]